ncbi:MAG: SRPBCC domain-containing protein [Nitrososphaeria archaeon]
MIELSGQNDIKRAGLLEFLKDPASFSKCIPNMESLEIKSAGEFSAKFRVEVPEEMGVSYLKNIGIKMNFTISYQNNIVNMHGEGRSMGLKIKLNITIEVTEHDGYSTMTWKASMDMGMLERMLGREKIDKFSGEIISQLVSCISSS